MRVLLVNPPIPKNFYNREFYLPSSLLYIGAVLKKNGDDVQLVDFKVPQNRELTTNGKEPSDESYADELLKNVSDFNPDLIGFGGLFSGNFLDILRLSEAVKTNFPEMPTVMGGAHPTMYTKEILENCPSLDWLVLGEGEDTVVELINQMKQRNYDFDRLDGFAYRTKDGIMINRKKHFIKNIDNIPLPAYDLINLGDYYVDTSKWHNPKKLKINTEIPIISTRSCPNDCNFCASSQIMGRGWRARSPGNVVDEIEYLYNHSGERHFSFMDDNFTLSKPRLIQICNEIRRRNLDIQFETHNGVSINTLDEEVIDAMASAGLTRIALPIESGSDYIRNEIMGKRLSREKISETMHSLRKHSQIYARAFFIIGMPEETHETLIDTYRMIQEEKFDRVHLTHIIPFPGTRVFEQALRDGLLRNIDIKNMYKADNLYQTNYDSFFIKPYNLELKDLHEFRLKCEALINETKH